MAEQKKPTKAQEKRLSILLRCKAEAKRRCQRCGAVDPDKLIAHPSHFELVCSKCLGAHAQSRRVEKAEKKKRQLGLFE